MRQKFWITLITCLAYTGEIFCVERLGGLLKSYHLKAA